MSRLGKRFRQHFEFSPREASGFRLLVFIILFFLFLPLISKLWEPAPYDFSKDEALLNELAAEISKVEKQSHHKYEPSKREGKFHEASALKKEVKVVPRLSLNQAKAHELQHVKGIGPVLSERIVKYREALGGFVHGDQLFEVYGLDSSTVHSIQKDFDCSQLKPTRTIQLGSCDSRQLAAHPYINKSQMIHLIDYRYRKGTILVKDVLKADSTIEIEALRPYLRN